MSMSGHACQRHARTLSNTLPNAISAKATSFIDSSLSSDLVPKEYAHVNIKKPRHWILKEALATPESVFANRREFLAGMGLGISGLTAAAVMLGQQGPAGLLVEADPSAGLYPAPRNPAFMLDRALTPESVNAKWNNFYEFGSHKEISGAAQALKLRPWMVKFDGLVEQPFELGIDDLLAKMKLEERLYRHRCVEAWSMTIPWSGFPMKDLVALAKPVSSAKYVRMETFNNPAVAPGQKQTCINPEVPHPRWSQATERILGTETRVPTLPYNGYGEQVAHLYQDIKGERLFT